jgi:hypothetical protein
MSSTVAVAPASRKAKSLLLPALAAGVALGIVIAAFANFGWVSNDGEHHPGLNVLISGAVMLAAAGALGWYLNRSLDAASSAAAQTRTLVLGILSLACLPVFWLGINPVFAAATFVSAAGASETGPLSTRAKIGAGLAGLTLVVLTVMGLSM